MGFKEQPFTIAMLSIHSSPIGELGKRDTGGMSVYIRELARVLGQQGHRIDIFTRLQDPRGACRLELCQNVRLIQLPVGTNGAMPTLALYPYLGEFARRLEQFRAAEGLHYDLIHSHYWLSGQVGRWLCEWWRVPHMIMFHTLGVLKNMMVKEERESELRVASERDLVQTCQRILAATAREKEHLGRYYGACSEKIRIVPCGVDLDRFHPMDKKQARQRLGFAGDGAIVLFVGRLSPIKGADRLLQAMSCLKGRNGMRLVVVGGDDVQTPASQKLRGLSRELGLQDAVEFAGRVEHEKLPPYYCAADVVVLPSHYESFGLVALEALASGTPVVATAVGAMDTIIRQGESGEIVANGSPLLLAAAIDRFLARRLNGGISAAAIRATVEGFAWSRVASAVVREYAAMVGDIVKGEKW